MDIYELSELKLRISLEVIFIVFLGGGASTFLSFFTNFYRSFILFSCFFRLFSSYLVFLSLSIRNFILL
jgi:hypothetical protein